MSSLTPPHFPPNIHLLPMPLPEEINACVHLLWDMISQQWATAPPLPPGEKPRPKTEAEFVAGGAGDRFLLRALEFDDRHGRQFGAQIVDSDIEPDWDAFPELRNVPLGEGKFHPTQCCTWIHMYAPHVPGKVPSEERRLHLIDKMVDNMVGVAEERKEGIRQQIIAEHELCRKILGEGFETKYYELGGLQTLTSQRRKGYASAVIDWSLKEVDRRRANGEAPDAIGVYIIASLAGCGTYKRAGFVEVGRRVPKEEAERLGLEEWQQHVWFVKKFNK